MQRWRPWRRAGRRTNLALLVLLAGALLSGAALFAAGTPVPARLAAVGHGLLGLGLVGLAPWKAVVVGRARRRHADSWVLLALVVVCLVSGFVAVFGGYGRWWLLSPVQVHVGSALLAVVFLGAHVVRHRWPRVRRSDLSRRRLLVVAGSTAVAGGAYAAAELLGAVVGSASASRVATGSHRIAAADVPSTIWLFDRVPDLDPVTYRVQVGDRGYDRDELDRRGVDASARLDCTGGWYADTRWTGVDLATLFDPDDLAGAGSIEVTSVTGYRRRFDPAEAGALWLATRSEGRLLSPGRGAPVRLVAAHHRGFWWVKWVASVQLSALPSAAQLPFPPQ